MDKRSKKRCQSYGLTQQHMATLLGISRAQWSMHESNVRDLPLRATKALRLMDEHIDACKVAKHVPDEQTMGEVRAGVLKLLSENAYRQETLKRKIDAANAYDAVVEKQRQVADYLTTSGRDKEAGVDSIRVLLDLTANQTLLDSKRAMRRIAMEIELEVLGFEEKLIREKLR